MFGYETTRGRLTFGRQSRLMNGNHVRKRLSDRGKWNFLRSSIDFLKGSTSRLAILPKRKLAMPEFTTYLRGSVEI